ncbi:MAG: STT3 domain-containing protein [Methanothermobacter sp.]|nr:STT3 domain-containing protein [Methanothermobacter sp.]
MKSKITILILAIIIFLLGFILRIGNYELSSPDKNLYYDDNGLQYFQESDSYYNYRLTRNLLEHGNLGDKIINGKPWDLHSYYPPGVPVDYPPLLPYITVGFYYILNFINSMNLREVCLWLPTALGPLAGVIGFLFSRRLNGEFGGFITGMLIVTAPLYVYKTNFGFFDTDMLNITLPLLIIWLIFEAENAKIKRDRMILAGCSGFFLFLFSLAWNGWIYYFYIIIIALIYNFIKRRDLTLFLSFISVSICLIGIFNIFSLYNALMAPYTQLGYLLRGENIWYPWPDPYKNVAELQKPNIETFIVIVSPLTFVFGLIGLFTIYKRAKSLIGLIIILWTVSALFSTLKGARFIILLIPPLSILAGIFWHEFKNTLKDKLNNIHKNKILHILQLDILFVIFFQFFLLLSVTSNFKPGYDDYFMEAAQWINNNTPEDTVIITDWSYGHFFASESNRPVAFDGRLAYIETLPIRGYW